MMRWNGLRHRLLVLSLTAATTGCSALTPFATGPLAAKKGVTDPGPRVAICYNTFKTPPEKIQQLAQAECFGNATAELVDTDYRLDDCPVLTPGRATFVCKPAK
jgi:hypothetical protein